MRTSTTLSNRQYPLLRLFIKLGQNGFMNLTDAATLDQRPFRSLLMREWIRWEPHYGFTITDLGREAWHTFGHTDIVRNNPNNPLCAFFYSSCGYTPPKAPRTIQARPAAKRLSA